MSLEDDQRDQLKETIKRARMIRSELQSVLVAHGDRVHFRPSSTGFAMVGLLHDSPQRGKSGLQNAKQTAADFESLFAKHCGGVKQGRPTPEKAFQSFLIREAHANRHALHSINVASQATNEPVELVFVTDEISLPVERGEPVKRGKMVCDLLALRRDGGRSTPVLLELKSDRMLGRSVEQVHGYAALIDQHVDLFAELFGALLDERIRLQAPTEKWIVWPSAGDGPDPREEELKPKKIRVVAYTEPAPGCYEMCVGDR